MENFDTSPENPDSSAFQHRHDSGEEPQSLEYRLRMQDEEHENHSYLEEQALWDMVKRGDTERVRSLQGVSYLKHPLVLDKDPYKNEEYMAVSSITLLARAVIEAGVPTRDSFILSDLYLKRIAQCRSIEQINNISFEAVLEFTLLVKEHREQGSRNYYIEECKKIVANSIFRKIGLSVICSKLGVQPTYLSRIFKAFEGLTVTDYIHRKKIEWACNMLKYSRRNVSEISLSLQFNSQSYFGKIFKKETGYTPRNYRKKFYIVDHDRPLTLQ